MTQQMANEAMVWRFRPWHWVLLAVLAAVLVFIFYDGLALMVAWWHNEEYSHGYMLPVVAAFFVWQKSGQLRQTPFRMSWVGVLIVVLGLGLYLVGELGSLYVVIQYAFLVTLGGLLLAFMGWRAFRIIWAPYVLLFFAVPLPNFLYNNLSSQLQLISSELGVAFLRAFGVSVLLEGNVIHLADYSLQVVEACSGLRYLFPLTALGFVAAYIFKGALWKKALLFLSTIPIAVVMNSFRIAVIGLLVDNSGIAMAEGFLHDFEGWAVFMACGALLVGEMWVLSRIGKDRMPLREAFAIHGPSRSPSNAKVAYRHIPTSLYPAAALLVAMAVVAHILPSRQELVVKRPEFLFFPVQIGEWRGHMERLDKVYVDSLRLDDYVLAHYSDGRGDAVNLYVAYYESQRKGASVHSPKSCLPGGGWRIQDFSQVEVPGARAGARPLRVNRALIEMGDDRRLVYYWFQERGRVLTNEYLVKWYLFWDALTKNRTDGALVRVTTNVADGEEPASADAVLSAFARSIAGPLQRFIPE